jgi:hypothetical protein
MAGRSLALSSSAARPRSAEAPGASSQGTVAQRALLATELACRLTRSPSGCSSPDWRQTPAIRPAATARTDTRAKAP